MNISNNMKRRFVKDMDIPINVFDDQYFSYFIDLFDSFYNSKFKYELLKSALDILGTEENFFSESDRIIKSIVSDISSNIVYKKFNSEKNLIDLIAVPHGNLYTAINDGQSFISIDLREANFQCLYRFDDSMFNGATSYQEYIRKFTKIPYFIQSKHLRQIIFGNLNPKRQQVFQRIMLEDVVKVLIDKLGIKFTDLFFMSHDELIIRYNKGTNYCINEGTDLIERITMGLLKCGSDCKKPVNVKIELFNIHKAIPNDMFIKHTIICDQKKMVLSYEDPKRISLRLVPAYFVSQLIRYIEGSQVTENDLLFYYEKMLCKFLNPLRFDIPFVNLLRRQNDATI